ncbi:MAG: carboxymuconolactone decarboxylase family protein [Armatimonadota bacterium]
MHTLHLAAAATLLAAGTAAAAPKSKPALRPVTVSAAQEASLQRHLQAELPTVFVFLRPDSSVEREFLAEIQGEAKDRVGLRVVHVRTGREPLVRQYDVKETPTAIIYDRRGRVTGRSSQPAEIRAALQKAAGVMRIDWAEEGDPRMDQVERILGRRAAPGILRTMSLKPEYMALVNELAGRAHFSDGFLDRRTKELIATYVSALNECKY